MDAIQLAAMLAAVVLVASIVSVEAGVTVARVELTLGVVVVVLSAVVPTAIAERRLDRRRTYAQAEEYV